MLRMDNEVHTIFYMDWLGFPKKKDKLKYEYPVAKYLIVIASLFYIVMIFFSNHLNYFWPVV